ncbi:tetratricopeptide repeat protein [Actinoplanes sp. NPDC051861]|uniref:tetratricopeptide repeat protein n=1 Tax=Actinoplanes sp. NPDC051861 TaxID=3155170 RepID=UPI00341BC51A
MSDDDTLAFGPTPGVWALGNAPVQVGAENVQNNYYFDRRDPTREELPGLAAPFGRLVTELPVRGREELIAEIEQARATPDSPDKVWVLHGFGGAGKSTVALAVAQRAESAGADVWWMRAGDRDSLATLTAALASRLGASRELGAGDNAGDLMWERLRVRRRPWLLVLDGLDDPADGGGPAFADGSGLVRPLAGGLGCVVITSRDPRPASWARWCRLREVPLLDPEAAGQILLDHAPHLAGSTAEARALGAALGGLPLALGMAGAALATVHEAPPELVRPGTPRTFGEYRTLLEPGQSDGDPPDVLGSIWEISLGAVRSGDRDDAAAMLGFLSCFADAPVPLKLLLRVEALRAALPRVSSTEDVARHLDALAKVGLLRIEPGSAETFSLIHVHRLVRRCCRADPHVRREMAGMQSHATVLINSLVTAELRDRDDWRLWAALEPHVFGISAAMVAGTGFSDDGVHLMCRLGILAAKSLQACGAYEAAGRRLDDVETLLRAHEPDPGIRHLELAEARAELARRRGRLAEAAESYREIYNAYARMHGLPHRTTIRAGAGLAGVLHQSGRARTAGDLLDLLLVAAREGLGEADRQTLALRANIACLQYELGFRDAAEEQIREVLAGQETALGTRDGDTLRTRLNLAQMCRFRRAFDESEAEYRTAIAAFDAVHGRSSTQSLSARISLAGLTREQGGRDTAEAMYRTVLADAQRSLGPDHLITQRAERRLQALVRGEELADSGVYEGLAADVRVRISTASPPPKGFVLGGSVPENHSGSLHRILDADPDATMYIPSVNLAVRSPTPPTETDPGARRVAGSPFVIGGFGLLIGFVVVLLFLIWASPSGLG